MQDHRRQLAERLRERSGELEDAIFDRICALEESLSGHHQLQGLRSVIRPAVEHGLAAVELGEHRAPEPPPALIAHARKAAWRSVSTPTLHERYTAGYSIFRRSLLREAGSVDLACEVQSSTDVVFERLTCAVREEHEREVQKRGRSREARRLERVEELLSGQINEAPELHYSFHGTHVGVVATGSQAFRQIPRLLGPLASHTLAVTPLPHRVWAWIKVHKDFSLRGLEQCIRDDWPSGLHISLGEAEVGLEGWRHTHQQANAALRLLPHLSRSVVLYGDVPVMASLRQDPLLERSLKTIYLEPLSHQRDGGRTLLSTLRAYLEAQCNVSSAAAALGVHRQTVSTRLKAVEDLLERPLPQCLRNLDAALQLNLDKEPQTQSAGVR